MAQNDSTMLDSLDAALHELGMLGRVTNARLQYLQELILQKNSRYVTNVSFGYRIKPACANNRAKPYHIRPRREERPRTRSENADAPPTGTVNITPIIENVVNMALDSTRPQGSAVAHLQKSKSLENVRIENDNASQPSHEMEFVSSRIQKLKMQD